MGSGIVRHVGRRCRVHLSGQTVPRPFIDGMDTVSLQAWSPFLPWLLPLLAKGWVRNGATDAGKAGVVRTDREISGRRRLKRLPQSVARLGECQASPGGIVRSSRRAHQRWNAGRVRSLDRRAGILGDRSRDRTAAPIVVHWGGRWRAPCCQGGGWVILQWVGGLGGAARGVVRTEDVGGGACTASRIERDRCRGLVPPKGVLFRVRKIELGIEGMRTGRKRTIRTCYAARLVRCDELVGPIAARRSRRTFTLTLGVRTAMLRHYRRSVAILGLRRV
jgi:hypothetical protein